MEVGDAAVRSVGHFVQIAIDADRGVSTRRHIFFIAL
jgi:hypothetical protein